MQNGFHTNHLCPTCRVLCFFSLSRKGSRFRPCYFWTKSQLVRLCYFVVFFKDFSLAIIFFLLILSFFIYLLTLLLELSSFFPTTSNRILNQFGFLICCVVLLLSSKPKSSSQANLCDYSSYLFWTSS